MKPGLPLAFLAAAGLAAAALANDSTAEMAAGGLVLKQSDAIDMVSEDLYVSAEQIRVRYVFRNRTARDVRTIVAFPMPDRNLAERAESDAAFPSDFATSVDGRPVRMQVERRAMLGAADHSALLRSYGVPIVEDESPVPVIGNRLDALSPERQQRLVRLGLAERTEWDEGSGMRSHLLPRWTVKETWHWEQVFPAGRDLVVEHRYTPGTGGTAGVPLAHREYRQSDDGRRAQADFCTDRAFLAALDRWSAEESRGGGYMTEQRVRYVLTTGGNWRAPIGDFRLVVDKGRPENIVSFCGTGLRRISPTQFEMRRRNWRPDRDLAVLIVRRESGD
ncbi:MAG TPA: DUF4424 domain-containing protein [Allosphingosinicella sp.]|jgi:hypothetical protein